MSEAQESAPHPVAADAPRTVVTGRAEFSATLDAFQGPLDLLLYLIKENEVEIARIPIAPILSQYLAWLDAATQWDLHLAGEFLVMAATLMEIKSRELLPVVEPLDGEEIIEDPRSDLVRQLLRYRALKDHARTLEALAEAWGRRRPRGWYDEVPEAPPDAEPAAGVDVELDLYELFAAYERLGKAVLAQVPGHVSYEGETLEEKLVRIEALLRERPFARFAELIGDARSRADIAMTFVALLELVRRRMIRLLQVSGAEIDVRVQTPEEAEAVAREEAAAAEQVVDSAFRERAEREEKLVAEAAALGVSVDRLPWKKRRAALARPKFEGIVKPEDLEEIDAEETEIGRRIDAILAAADAISQRFEDSRAGAVLPAAAPAAAADEKPLTEADLAPTPDAPEPPPAPAQPVESKPAAPGQPRR